jgi:Concanavalin A-like lectin/glucanases superfamily
MCDPTLKKTERAPLRRARSRRFMGFLAADPLRGERDGTARAHVRQRVLVLLFGAAFALCLSTGGLSLSGVDTAAAAGAPVSCPNSNPIVNENNCMGPGTTAWQITNDTGNEGGSGPVGFAVQPSYNLGQSIQLKIGSYDQKAVNLSVYRMGYYGGTGGRLIYTSNNVAVTNYANCDPMNATTGEVDCDNWDVDATIPGSVIPISGVYIVKLVDTSNGDQSQILFVVRSDSSNSPVLLKIPTATYEAYNSWGGKSLYDALSSGTDLVPGHPRAHAVSFERPMGNESNEPNWFFHDEFALIYWMEEQGYNISYTDSTEIAENPSSLLNHKVIVVGGHDEYWSGGEMAAFKAAIAAGVNVASFSANTSYWKVEYEDNFQTVTEYKTIGDGSLGVNDPGPDGPTTTFRDPGAPAGAPNAPAGGRVGPNDPENSLWGELYVGDNDNVSYPLVVPPSDGKGDYAGNPIWRNTGINPSTGATIGTNLVGWEWDAVPNAASPLYSADLGVQPSGVKQLTQTPLSDVGLYEFLQDNGYTYATSPPPGQPSDSESVMYTAPSGATVFSAGTIQWPWALGPYWIPQQGAGDTYFQAAQNTESPILEQATYNILSDMGVQPDTPVGVTTGSGTTTTPVTTTPTTTTPAKTTTTPTTTTGTGGSPSGGSVTTPYAKAILGTPGLIDYWRLGDPVGSSSFASAFGGVNAPLSGKVTLGGGGAISQDSDTSAAFDGSTASASAALNLSGDSVVTVQFWLKWTAYANGDQLALEFTPNFNNNSGGFLVDPNASTGPSSNANFGVAIGQGASRNTIYFARPSAGQWHQYTFVLNSTAPAATQVTPYVDGQPVPFTQTAAGTGAGNFANSTLYWMSRDGSALFGAGSMQDLSIYKNAVPASTILQDYEIATGTGGSTPTGPTGPTTTPTSTTPVKTTPVKTTPVKTTPVKTTPTKTTPVTTTPVKTTPVVTTPTTTTPGSGGSTSGSLTTPYAKAVLGNPGLIDYWRLGDPVGATAFASAFGGIKAPVAGGVTLGGAGAIAQDGNTSALFNGSSGSASAPLNLSGDSVLTVQFWMKWQTYGNDDRLALEFTPNFNNNNGGFLIDPDASNGPSSNAGFGVAIGEGSSRNTIYFARPSAGQWHQYTFVFNAKASAGTVVTPYVDGAPVGFTQTMSGTGAGNFANSTLYWMSRDGNSLFGAGSMQDLAIYNQALSAATIQNDYQIGTNTTPSGG